jgi:protein TonB
MMIARRQRGIRQAVRGFFGRLVVAAAAVGLTVALFLVLPLMQTISEPPTSDLMVRAVEGAQLDPPPPVPEDEPEEEPEEDEPPPELAEEAEQLPDFPEISGVLNPLVGDGWGTLGTASTLSHLTAARAGSREVIRIADLDRPPRVTYQPSPVVTDQIRRKAPGVVHVIFIVDEGGRTTNVVAQKSSDPIFERAAVSAVRQWRFKPGKRNGRPVRFRMRVPIRFPRGL